VSYASEVEDTYFQDIGKRNRKKNCFEVMIAVISFINDM
jgi:hypothetical protein